MTKLRCWPGCLAQIVRGRNLGRVVTVEAASQIHGTGWWYVRIHGAPAAGTWHETNEPGMGNLGHIEDRRLAPITPRPGTVTEEEVADLWVTADKRAAQGVSA